MISPQNMCYGDVEVVTRLELKIINKINNN